MVSPGPRMSNDLMAETYGLGEASMYEDQSEKRYDIEWIISITGVRMSPYRRYLRVMLSGFHVMAVSCSLSFFTRVR